MPITSTSLECLTVRRCGPLSEKEGYVRRSTIRSRATAYPLPTICVRTPSRRRAGGQRDTVVACVRPHHADADRESVRHFAGSAALREGAACRLRWYRRRAAGGRGRAHRLRARAAGGADAGARGWCTLRSGTVIYAGSEIRAGFETGHHVVVREESVIGDNVSVWTNSVVRYGCVTGNRVKIRSNCYVAQFSELAEDVFLAPGVTLANDLYAGRTDSAEVMSGPLIEAGAQIGVNGTVLPFVTVGKGAIIGPGAVVTRDIPAETVAYGCPAVPGKSVAELEDIQARIEPVESAVRRFGLRRTSQK